MFQRIVIRPKTALHQQYLEQRQLAFPFIKLKPDEHATHIGVFWKSKLVGGASFFTFSSISDDEDLRRHWEVILPCSATRISRLWTVPNHPTATLQQIFFGLDENLANGSFLYGILSLPLDYALESVELFSIHSGRLRSKLGIEKCQWSREATPSSEGKKLLPIYRRLGATCLGPVSGNQEDHSIRVVLGMPRGAVNFRRPARPRLPAARAEGAREYA